MDMSYQQNKDFKDLNLWQKTAVLAVGFVIFSHAVIKEQEARKIAIAEQARRREAIRAHCNTVHTQLLEMSYTEAANITDDLMMKMDAEEVEIFQAILEDHHDLKSQGILSRLHRHSTSHKRAQPDLT